MVNLHLGQTGERNYHNLNDITTDLVELIRKTLPRRIQVDAELAPVPLPVHLDVVEFRQVAINLLLNAADAMPQGRPADAFHLAPRDTAGGGEPERRGAPAAVRLPDH